MAFVLSERKFLFKVSEVVGRSGTGHLVTGLSLYSYPRASSFIVTCLGWVMLPLPILDYYEDYKGIVFL